MFSSWDILIPWPLAKGGGESQIFQQFYEAIKEMGHRGAIQTYKTQLWFLNCSQIPLNSKKTRAKHCPNALAELLLGNFLR